MQIFRQHARLESFVGRSLREWPIKSCCSEQFRRQVLGSGFVLEEMAATMHKGNAACATVVMLAMSLWRSQTLSDLLADGVGGMRSNDWRTYQRIQLPSYGQPPHQVDNVISSARGAWCQLATALLVARVSLLMPLVHLASAAGGMGRTSARWLVAQGDAIQRNCLPCRMEDSVGHGAHCMVGPHVLLRSARLNLSSLLKRKIHWGRAGRVATGTLGITEPSGTQEHPNMQQTERCAPHWRQLWVSMLR
mmetsp:Transcript_35200/g.80588  ORF Transcript_35200/g.80588 Transcript_35200/m.80588 type:complete len:249 (-) Transcript_35200:4-750(-)